MRGETKLQRQLISLHVGHESPFKVKTKLKQAVVALGGRTWHARLGSEIREGKLSKGSGDA